MGVLLTISPPKSGASGENESSIVKQNLEDAGIWREIEKSCENGYEQYKHIMLQSDRHITFYRKIRSRAEMANI